MDEREFVETVRRRILEGRLKLIKMVAITATIVAAYYIGKSTGRVSVKIYRLDRGMDASEILRSMNLR